MLLKKRSVSLGLLYLYIALSWFFTFVYNYDFDKYSVVLIGFFISVLPVMSKSGFNELLTILKKTKFNIFLSLFIIGYLYQYLKYDQLVNVQMLTLLGLYLSIVFLMQVSDFFVIEKALLTYCLLFLFSSFLTIQESPAAWLGYSYVTGAGGILSSFILFSVFLGLISLGGRYSKGKVLAVVNALLILLFQIRGPILSMLVAIIVLKGIGKRFIYAVIAASIGLLAFYFINPNSRIFSTETSGRVIHWEIILDKFEPTLLNTLFGMGAEFSTNVLIYHGVGETMAAPHNEYIRYGVDLGLLGALMISMILYNLYKVSRSLMIVLVIVQQMITDNIFTYFHNYLFFIVMVAVYLGRKNSIRD